MRNGLTGFGGLSRRKLLLLRLLDGGSEARGRHHSDGTAAVNRRRRPLSALSSSEGYECRLLRPIRVCAFSSQGPSYRCGVRVSQWTHTTTTVSVVFFLTHTRTKAYTNTEIHTHRPPACTPVATRRRRLLVFIRASDRAGGRAVGQRLKIKPDDLWTARRGDACQRRKHVRRDPSKWSIVVYTRTSL